MMRKNRLHLAFAFILGLGGFGLARPLGAASVALSARTAASSPAWLGVGSGAMREKFPAFALSPERDFTALKRILSQTALAPRIVDELDSAAREVELFAQLRQEAQRLAVAPAPGDASALLPVQEIREAQQRSFLLEDLLVLSESDAAREEFSTELVARLRQARQSNEKRLGALNERLLRATASAKDVVWHGRTAVITLPEGDALALKFSKGDGARNLEREGGLMTRSASFGLELPIALASSEGSYARAAAGLPQEFAAKRQEHFLPYLIPREMARDYFSYLGDPLPAGMTAAEKKLGVESAALKSIDELTLLLRHGYVHTSLAPISHSKTAWKWDYWRWTDSVFSPMRFGPSSIHDWLSALSYANIRASGLADFEHVESAGAAVGRPVGQNLTEWALLVMRAGVNNGLSSRETTEILARGIRLHAAGQALPARFSLDARTLDRALASAARRFYRFHRLAAHLPRSLTRLVNGITNCFVIKPLGRDELIAIPGSVLQPLIMDAIWPYTRALQGEAPRAADRYGHFEEREIRVAPLWEMIILETLPAAFIVPAIALGALALPLAGILLLCHQAAALPALGLAAALLLMIRMGTSLWSALRVYRGRLWISS